MVVIDGLVKSDKIGAMKYISQLSDSTHPSTNPNSVSFYWCFPSDVGQSLANTEEKLKASVEALTKELEVETAIVQVERDERVDSVSSLSLNVYPIDGFEHRTSERSCWER